ncbi:MAG: aspartate--tRNA ligase [Actinomycetia bacterium]|nr:aspartate--tRNA ligase [Actinomycetes bacterium]
MKDSKFKTGMRSNLCSEINRSFVGKEVSLCGWINKRRDHGKLIFIDLRDFSGIVQLVFDPNSFSEAYGSGKDIRNEFVIQASGKVRKRSEETINKNIPTGEIEVIVSSVKIFSRSNTPPFMLEHRDRVDENTRLKYRYIDLRSEQMQHNMRLRHEITKVTRDYFNSIGFVEIETPILAKSTPEGARDFLVPSRINPGKFYALPQSPQLFKQTLMFSGFDRIYQIARCFRDEDLRADRQPEFTQIDLEMTFVEVDDVIRTIEGLFNGIFEHVMGSSIKTPFKRITWQEGMETYGSDKPDLRYGLELKDITEVFLKSELKIFKNVINSGGIIKCIVVPEGDRFSRKELDDLVDLAKSSGAKGLAWIRTGDEMEFQSPITKFLTQDEIKALTNTLSLGKNNLILMVADEFKTTCKVLGDIRVDLAKKLDLTGKDVYEFVWVYDFPLFEWDENEKRLTSVHHPFTRPDEDGIKSLEDDPLKARSLSYDIVLNGQEIGGGSIRINESKLQKRIFKLLNIDDETIEENFGFLVKALDFGVPPHGGIALGMDRIVMILGKLDTIREVIAFPKTQSAIGLLTGSPSMVTDKQLEEVHIEIKLEEEDG